MENTNDVGSQETKPLTEQINTILATADDKGIIPFAEDVDPVFKQLVLTEKRSRAHQAKAIKALQEATSLKAANQVLTKTIESSAQLTAEQIEELEDLKLDDPDEWFTKKTQYEREAQANAQGKIEELTTAASTQALESLTVAERTEALEEFQKKTGLVLTDDVMDNDIPPRLKNKINDMPFEDYLNAVATYLGKGKTVKQTDKSLDQVDLETLNGGDGSPAPRKSSKSTIL